MLREVLDLRIFRFVILLVGSDLGLKCLLLVGAFSRHFLSIDSFLVSSSEGFLRDFTGGGALLVLVFELCLEGVVRLFTLGDLFNDRILEHFDPIAIVSIVVRALELVDEFLKRSLNFGFVGALLDLGENIFVPGGHFTVEGGVDVFQLSELRLDLLRELLVDWAERSGLGGEGYAFGNECHA